MAVQNPPVKGGFEPPVMSFSGVVIGPALLCGLPSPASHATARRDLPIQAPPTPCAPLRHPARGRPTTCQLGSLDRGTNRHVTRPWMSPRNFVPMTARLVADRCRARSSRYRPSPPRYFYIDLVVARCWKLVVTTEFSILELACSRPGSIRACAPTGPRSTRADNI
jgi:hypothetical protein